MNRTASPTRIALAVSTVAVLALGLTACAGSAESDTASPEATVTVTETPHPMGTTAPGTGSEDNGRADDTRTQDRAGCQVSDRRTTTP